jgi:hypothetical protein
MDKTVDDYDQHDDLDWFREELRRRDREIRELRQQQREADDLIRRLREHAEDYKASIEAWCETFGMELTDDGWSWQPFWDGHWKLVDKWNALVRDWNRCLPLINGHSQPVGRPLAASEVQVTTVLKLRKQGKSLRWITDETNLSLQTVRTIVDRKHGTDRTIMKRYEKLGIDKSERLRRRRQKRTGDALPKRLNTFLKTGAELVKEAKGLSG